MRKFWALFATLILITFAIPNLVSAGGSAVTKVSPIKELHNKIDVKENKNINQRNSTSESETKEVLPKNQFLCNFGVGTCINPESYRKAGAILPWYELLSIAAIIFVVSEFAENSKTRLFLFHLSILKPWMIISIVGSIILVGFANLILFASSFNVPVISYPATYEVLSLIILSSLFIGFCAFIYKPYWFRPKFSYTLLSKIVSLFRTEATKRASLPSLFLQIHI